MSDAKMSDDGKTLWIDRAAGALYLVPDGEPLSPGSLELHNLWGRRVTVDPSQAAAYSITREAAQARMDDSLSALLGAPPAPSGETPSAARPSPDVGAKMTVELEGLWQRLAGKLSDALGGLAPAIAEAVADTAAGRMPTPEPEDVASGLRFSHVVEMETKRRLGEVGARLEALIEALKASGALDPAALETALPPATQREQERIRSEALVVLSEVEDKYALTDLPEIDCAARLPLCHGRCCTFVFPLSTQDLDERVVRWEYGRPYQIGRRGDGYCVHCDETSHQCTVYHWRPATCRTYDCRRDARIWVDFDRRIPAP